jgi:hypothetical protein
MKETTKKILSALANVDSGEIRGLPLDRNLYPEASVDAAVAAFCGHCLVTAIPGTGSVDVQVHSEHLSESRQVLGTFLNFLLCDAASRQSS